ncbi:hypothetical protein PO909_032826 [Leuciscus waleckii]
MVKVWFGLQDLEETHQSRSALINEVQSKHIAALIKAKGDEPSECRPALSADGEAQQENMVTPSRGRSRDPT